MAENNQQPTVHLRTACDTCSEAKVKCDKKHPACKRCLEVNATCTYSKSRKHGKQTWRKKAHHDRGAQIATTAAAATTEAIGDSSQSIVASSVPIMALPGQLGWNAILNGPSGPAMDNPSLDSILDNQLHGSSDVSAIASTWSFDSSDFNAAASFANWDMTETFAPLANSAADTGSIPQPSPQDSHEAAKSVPNGPPTSFATPDTSSAHDCEARAIAILSSMQHGQLGRGAATCSTQLTSFNALNLRPRFDSVIATNRSALEGWTKLMRCQCTQCPHLIMLYVAILSKMLFWYRIAARDSMPLRDAREPEDSSYASSNSSSAGSPSQQDAPTPRQFSINLTAIQVGDLSLDAEEQANLRCAFLLRELRKTEKAIDEFMNIDRTHTDDDGDEAIRTAVDWSISGVTHVRQQLKEVIQQIENRSA